jgi:hemerythrin-like domain-containing protein
MQMPTTMVKKKNFFLTGWKKKWGQQHKNFVRHGMLVEHDLGRLHMQELEAAVKRVLEGDDESKLDIKC